MARGFRANRSGRRLERAVGDLLSEGYQQVAPAHFFALRTLSQPIFAEQCAVGEDIYGKSRRVDFILYHPSRWADCLVIQCKWQASSGTVEQKFPFEVLSIEKNPYATLIVLDGGGYSDGAEKWLAAQAGSGKLLHVLDLGDICRFHSQGHL